jgi:hypothetical protein
VVACAVATLVPGARIILANVVVRLPH